GGVLLVSTKVTGGRNGRNLLSNVSLIHGSAQRLRGELVLDDVATPMIVADDPWYGPGLTGIGDLDGDGNEDFVVPSSSQVTFPGGFPVYDLFYGRPDGG